VTDPKRFSPGVIDYDGRMSAGYRRGRTLSREAAETWVTIVAPFVRTTARARILDLGAGTGRFSALFAGTFDADVVGVDPSQAMLAVANREAKLRNLTYVAGRAELVPLRGDTCDLVWLSHVWHHIRDQQACVGELRRVMSPGSHVLVRGTFGDQLDGFPTLFRYWPATKRICQQLPTIQQTIGVFGTKGFRLAEQRRVQQITCASLREFAARTQLRADTSLALISDEEFSNGQTAIEEAAAHERPATPVVELIELLVFRNEAS
jgi:ubiquinone/menaquinone biosynthesis C-methylase UbiE